MAERIVDVLEMVEVDVEDRGLRAAGLHFGDHGFQPFAEEGAIRQPAERIMHGEMPQPVLAGGDRGSGAAHIAQHEQGQHREAGDRHCHEGITLRMMREPGCFGVQAKRASVWP